MAFDQTLTLGSPPSFRVLWSSQPTPSGHYVGAFAFGNVQNLTPGVTVQYLIQTVIPQPRFVPNVGFFVAGQAPTQATAVALQQSAQAVINTYQPVNNVRVGGMILWLGTFGAFTRATAFGLFLPAIAGPPPTYRLDPQGSHLLFNFNGSADLSRQLSATAPAQAVQLIATPGDPMSLTLQATGGPLSLAFGASAYYGAAPAVAPQSLAIQFDNTKPTAGSMVFSGPTGPGLRNFELG